MKPLLYLFFIAILISGCAPSIDHKTFVPTDPTDVGSPTSPSAPVANNHHYYNVNFEGRNSGSSSGLQINGSQTIFLPIEIPTYQSAPNYIIIYSTTFVCFYDKNQLTYYRRSTCESSYDINDQKIYVNNLRPSDLISIRFGIDSNI